MQACNYKTSLHRICTRGGAFERPRIYRTSIIIYNVNKDSGVVSIASCTLCRRGGFLNVMFAPCEE